jgi:hypothetical protein
MKAARKIAGPASILAGVGLYFTARAYYLGLTCDQYGVIFADYLLLHTASLFAVPFLLFKRLWWVFNGLAASLGVILAAAHPFLQPVYIRGITNTLSNNAFAEKLIEWAYIEHDSRGDSYYTKAELPSFISSKLAPGNTTASAVQLCSMRKFVNETGNPREPLLLACGTIRFAFGYVPTGVPYAKIGEQCYVFSQLP